MSECTPDDPIICECGQPESRCECAAVAVLELRRPVAELDDVLEL